MYITDTSHLTRAVSGELRMVITENPWEYPNITTTDILSNIYYINDSDIWIFPRVSPAITILNSPRLSWRGMGNQLQYVRGKIILRRKHFVVVCIVNSVFFSLLTETCLSKSVSLSKTCLHNGTMLLANFGIARQSSIVIDKHTHSPRLSKALSYF